MNFKIKIAAFLSIWMAMFATSCFKDLDTSPIDPDVVTSAAVYNDPASYKKVLAKLYAGLALSGQQGPAGQPDISGIDEGFSTYLRQYWKAQELTTDEAVIAWNDGNIHDFHQQDWDANNEFITAMYNRIFYQISLCNEFLRETTDEKLNSRGVDAALRTEIKRYRAEARFLRALSYWHALDMFRNPPFVTEDDKVGAFFPRQTNASELFNWIESELKAIEGDLAAPRTNEYGRADQAAAWMVLAKLYLNAEVYVGQRKFSECAAVCQRIIDAGYQLEKDYRHLFLADNHKRNGIIFAVNFDGVSSRTWGGMTFLVHAAVGGSMNIADFGIDGGWGGIRTTSAIVNKFPALAGGQVVVAPNPGNQNYPVLYVPGAYQTPNAWDPSNPNTVLTSPNNDGKFEGYLYFAEAGTNFKFTTGPNWTNNFGDNGADGTLEPNGANIVAADAGYYQIKVDLNAKTFSMLKTEWGLIGSATKDGWGSDQNMTYNPSEGAWVITTDLVAGEIKFRANDDWALNYGDNGADGILEEGGANIKITEAGTYIVKLYIDRPDYTFALEKPLLDRREMFYTQGQNKEIADVFKFTEGYAIAKFKNVTSDGKPGKNLTWVDTDFPMFRVEDAMLMYAEAVLRGGGDRSKALQYVNQIRERAFDGPGANINDTQLTLDFILDERARELVWECHRRTDLVRYGRFSESTYLWPWKGGVPAGISTSKHLDVFPIPASDIGANPNLKQNSGY